MRTTRHVWDERHVEVQDRQNELDAVARSRARTAELLAGCDVVVDLGCGTGIGAVDMVGFAIGIDSSPVMVAATARLGVACCRGRVEALPIRTKSVDGVRCDRVLYHLAEPRIALAEAVRITRTGGRIVCTHPDHESMVIAVPGAPEHLVALTKWGRTELNYVNGRVARLVPEMLVDLGCRDVRTEAFTVVIHDPDALPYAFPLWLRQWADAGQVDVDREDLDRWDVAIDAARNGSGFFFTLTYLLTSARVA